MEDDIGTLKFFRGLQFSLLSDDINDGGSSGCGSELGSPGYEKGINNTDKKQFHVLLKLNILPADESLHVRS